MSQELRRRNPSAFGSSGNTMDGDKRDDDELQLRYAAGLRVPNMLKGSPQHSGNVYKLHIPLLFSVLPRVVQQWMLKIKFLSFVGLLPSWEPRFLILLGRFLYKFSNRQDSKAPPKGKPLPLESADFLQIPEDDIPFDENSAALLKRPDGFQHIIVFSTLRKRHYYAVPSREDASTWINSLMQAREDAIKRGMGHCPPDSYPATWSHFDNLGDNLVKSADRIEKRLHEGELREFEMTHMGAGGPPPGMSTGVYG